MILFTVSIDEEEINEDDEAVYVVCSEKPGEEGVETTHLACIHELFTVNSFFRSCSCFLKSGCVVHHRVSQAHMRSKAHHPPKWMALVYPSGLSPLDIKVFINL